MASTAPTGAPPAAAAESEPLLAALRRAEPRGPKGLARPDPGAALALAAFCCMLDAGFEPLLPPGGDSGGGGGGARGGGGGGGSNSKARAAAMAAPPSGWDKAYPDEWVFELAHPERGGGFRLHCSLQRPSGRMLVSAVEAGAPRNHHMLGLQLSNYVPGGTAALTDAADWAGVVARQSALRAMVKEHIVGPLLDMADAPLGPAPSGPLLQPPAPATRCAWASEAARRLLGPVGSAERRRAAYGAAALAGAAAALVAVALLARSPRGRRLLGSGGLGGGGGLR